MERADGGKSALAKPFFLVYDVTGKEIYDSGSCLPAELRYGKRREAAKIMLTDKDDIRINHAVLHILDSYASMPVLSDAELETGSDLCDFLKAHIYRLQSGDDLKSCTFYKEESEVYRALQDYSEENFIPITQMLASMLYEIMCGSPDIAPGDFIFVEYRAEQVSYLAMLKMNYKLSYTHKTESEGLENKNSITRHRAILPAEGQRLSEACFVNLEDYSVQLIEKKYEVNGEKTAYFSELFLKCVSALSPKKTLSVVTKAVEQVQKKYFDEGEQLGVSMEAKNIIHEELADEGSLNIPRVIDKIFKEKEEFKQEVMDRLDKYNIAREVAPKSEATVKRYEKQCLTTDTGIELRIPMEQYRNPDNVQFITGEDGTISVLLKNIGHIISK